jgi:hypothetical protein
MGWGRRRFLVRGVAILAVCQIAPIAAAALADGPTVTPARLVHARSRPSGAIVVTVNVLEPGQLTVVGLFGAGAPRAGAASVSTPRPVPKVFGSVLANPTAPATLILRLHPSAAARRALRRRHHLRVYITVALLPSHGSSVILTTRATARLRVHRHR